MLGWFSKSRSESTGHEETPSRVSIDKKSFQMPGDRFDEWLYLYHNADVALAVREGRIESGQQHFIQHGLREYTEGRRPRPASIRELSYLLRNPDIAAAVKAGRYASGYEHWVKHGRDEEDKGMRRPYHSSASTDTSDFDLSAWQDGYVILPRLFSSSVCDEIIEVTQKLWRDRHLIRQPIDVDIFLNLPTEKKVALCDAPDEAHDHPFKINNLYYWTPEVRSLVLDQRLCRVLRNLLGGDPVAFTSLNFRKGSEQGMHLDTFYMPPVIPHRMVAVWIALEDVSDENGPLKYVPGSNRISPHYFDGHRLRVNHSAEEYQDFANYYLPKIQKNELQTKSFWPKKGDALIWHALLYHGGAPIMNQAATRQSVVAHFFPAADYPGGSCTGATQIISHSNGCYYEERPPSLKPRLSDGQFSF